jgi:hypothetical protein
LEEPFNVGENLTRSQDARLHKNIKLIRDFGLLFTHSLMSCKLQALCVTHKIILMIIITTNTLVKRRWGISCDKQKDLGDHFPTNS